jgi:protein PhnA
MAKGLDEHKQRNEILNSFGKSLVRRSKSKCELCGDSGVKLLIYEVPPSNKEPDYDFCIMLCEQCLEQVSSPKKMNCNHLRFLQETIWSEIIPIQVISLRLLKRIVSECEWAQPLLDDLWVDDDIMEIVDKIKL